MINIFISDELKALAKAIDKPLYVVGGYVRDAFMGYISTDIDICSSVSTEHMINISTKLGYNAVVINKKLGTLKIVTKKHEIYEYTPFRRENYEGGKHTPSNVEFVDDINLDAMRRDFTVNCIYVNVLTSEIFDPYNGICDIKNKTIKCVETPKIVFSHDGLRLLRMVRFAVTLGFKIAKPTLNCAKNMIYQLKDISAERKSQELSKIVCAERLHGFKNNDFIKYFNNLNIYKYLFNLPLNKYKIKLNKYYYKFLQSEDRFISFLVLFLLNKYHFKYMPYSQIEYDVNNLITLSLKLSDHERKNLLSAYKTINLISFQKLSYNVASIYGQLSPFSKVIVDKYCSVKKVNDMMRHMKEQNIPLSKRELDITANDLKNIVGEKYISLSMNMLLDACLKCKVKNNKDQLIEYLITNFKV